MIFDKAEITLWPTKIRLALNGSTFELLRPAVEDRVRFWPPSRYIDKAGEVMTIP
jgi:hypothetical protein